jgi:protein SCO1/2
MVLAVVWGVMASSACAEDAMTMDMTHARTTDEAHEHHHMVMPETTRHTVEYSIPDVMLVREDGKSVSLPAELNDGRPVVLSFIYTTCTTVCPVTSQTLSQLQQKLGTEQGRVHLVSISIDPEQDTPARLADYAKKFDAGPEWNHYTGTLNASIAVQKAFNAYHGNKMDHTPVTFLRAAPGQPWVRFDGFATSDVLISELRGMLASR